MSEGIIEDIRLPQVLALPKGRGGTGSPSLRRRWCFLGDDGRLPEWFFCFRVSSRPVEERDGGPEISDAAEEEGGVGEADR